MFVAALGRYQCPAQRKAESINTCIDLGSQHTLITENLWLNAIITHSKFISRPFIYLFLTIVQIISQSFASLYRDDIVVTVHEINASDTCHSVD